jgi:hypothetical protein
MQDYAHAQALPPLSQHSQKRRAVGFRYLIPTGILLGFLLFLISVGVQSLGKAVPKQVSEASPTPTQLAMEGVETISPTAAVLSPTPSAAVVNKALRLLVLNGSGEAGVAGKMRQELRGLGYTNIRTDNAEDFSYTDIVIQATAASRKDATALRQQLSQSHTVSAVEPVASAAADIIVIVGK